MDDDSALKRFFEATLALPLPEYEPYKDGGAPYSPLTVDGTHQKTWGNHLQAFQHFSAGGPGSSQSSNITDAAEKKTGKVPEATTNNTLVAKKRMIDKAYRERCKKHKMEMEKDLELLRKENDRLKGENDSLKTEAVRTRQTLESQEEETKRLRKTIVLLKEKHDKQNIVVDIFSKRLAGANDTDLQRENKLLKSKIHLLMGQANERNNLDKFQLLEKNARLQHEKSSLEVIVQALCEKINNEKGHEAGQES